MDINESFIDQNMSFGKAPGSGMPDSVNSFSQGQSTVTPAYLDQLINNESEHPEIRANAAKMKKQLFPHLFVEEEEDIVEEQPVVVKKPKVVKKKVVKKITPSPKINIEIEEPEQDIPSKQITKNEFSDFLKEFKTELYTDSIELPSDPENLVKLKAMTVEEYKFLTKQLEIFESKVQSIQSLDDNLDKKKRIQLAEITLNIALDVLLSRCIVSKINVESLTIYDWVYLLLYLRLVSRGEDCKFKIRKTDADEDGNEVVTDDYIEFDLSELLDYLISNRNRYSKKIIKTIDINDAISLCVMPITRGDYAFMQKEYSKDTNSTLSILGGAVSCKAFIKNSVAHIMSLPQRIELTNTLHYDVIQEVMDCYDYNNDRFFEVINEFIKSKNANAEEVEISDFILFFYDF